MAANKFMMPSISWSPNPFGNSKLPWKLRSSLERSSRNQAKYSMNSINFPMLNKNRSTSQMNIQNSMV